MESSVHVEVVHGNLLDQDVDAIVNAWNRNIIPWCLLLPQGVSGAMDWRSRLSSQNNAPGGYCKRDANRD